MTTTRQRKAARSNIKPATSQCGVFSLECAFDLLAPDLQKREIRAVAVPVETFGNLGLFVRVLHTSAQTTGLRKQVTSRKTAENKSTQVTHF